MLSDKIREVRIEEAEGRTVSLKMYFNIRGKGWYRPFMQSDLKRPRSNQFL